MTELPARCLDIGDPLHQLVVTRAGRQFQYHQPAAGVDPGQFLRGAGAAVRHGQRHVLGRSFLEPVDLNVERLPVVGGQSKVGSVARRDCATASRPRGARHRRHVRLGEPRVDVDVVAEGAVAEA